MERAKIEVELDNGQMLSYNINSTIQEGLYLTMDKDLIDENILNFDIDIKTIPNQIATKISKHNKVAIISFVVDENRKYQYLVSQDLDFEKLERTNLQEVPEQIKGLIREAYSFIKKNS